MFDRDELIELEEIYVVNRCLWRNIRFMNESGVDYLRLSRRFCLILASLDSNVLFRCYSRKGSMKVKEKSAAEGGDAVCL